MTIELGGPGISGFGYGSQGPQADNDQAPQKSAQAAPEMAQAAPEIRAAAAASAPHAGNGAGQTQATNSGASSGGPADGDTEEVAAHDLDYDQVPGFEMSASHCVNRARQIARSLNHATLSSDHLMLALTMDQGARRLLERAGDVVQLRAAAMRKLGKNYDKSDAVYQTPAPTSDLADIGKKARETAAEREQMVSISDLINAFPKENGRLTYGAGESSRAVTVIETIETRVIPGVDNAVTRIENAIVDAVQRQHQSVQSILSDLSSRQSQEWEQRQRDFMEEVRRQVREAADMQFAVAFRDLNEKFEQKLVETKPEPQLPVSTDDPLAPTTSEVPRPEQGAEAPKSNWNWLGLIL